MTPQSEIYLVWNRWVTKGRLKLSPLPLPSTYHNYFLIFTIIFTLSFTFTFAFSQVSLPGGGGIAVPVSLGMLSSTPTAFQQHQQQQQTSACTTTPAGVLVSNLQSNMQQQQQQAVTAQNNSQQQVNAPFLCHFANLFSCLQWKLFSRDNINQSML